MPVEIKLSEDDYAFVEKVLLGPGKSFDEERRAYLENYDSLDLRAVPGSGKTTVLLAKLLVMERHFSFSDQPGILVISHTNKAVDIIKDRIGNFCPNLFRYPNFVGTIQSFVNQFLALPYFRQIVKNVNARFSENDYRKKVDMALQYCLAREKMEIFRNVKHIYRSDEKKILNYRFGWEGSQLVVRESKDGKILEITRPGNKKKNTYEDYSGPKKRLILEYLIKLKKSVMKTGILTYDDAYFLADLYLETNPRIASIIRKRFRYVFIDEMQDMDKSQVRVMENLFGSYRNSSECFQRLGDNNQAIFSRKTISSENFWQDSPNSLRIAGSHRLTAPVGKIVQRLAIDGGDVVGLGSSGDSSLLPHLIVYSEENKHLVVERFCELIVSYRSEGLLPMGKKEVIRAIGWRRYSDADHKNCISSFSKTHQPKKEEKTEYHRVYDFFASIINLDLGSEKVHKYLIDIFIQVLRLEKIKDSEGREYTYKSLFKYLDAEMPNAFESLKLFLFRCCKSIAHGKPLGALSELRDFIPEFMKSTFSVGINNANDYVFSDPEVEMGHFQQPPTTEVESRKPNVEIEINTIHSEKGQTHTATLMLESFYERKNDLERIFPAISGEKTIALMIEENEAQIQELREKISDLKASGTKGVKTREAEIEKTLKEIARIKECAKMAYVAMSRPTHLLCVSVSQAEFQEYLSYTISASEWVIDSKLATS